MKKLFVVFMIVICSIMMSSCNVLYRRRMVEYFSNDNAFEQLSGTIKDLDKDSQLIRLNISEASEEFIHQSSRDDLFIVYGFTESGWESANLSIGDEIVIISAPRIFYDSYRWPIVSLEKNGVTYLEYEDGVAALRDWAANF